MEYKDLKPDQKMHVNGVLAKFMDDYIRNHLIWTPEQMYVALYEEITEQHNNGWYGYKQCINGEWIFPYYEGNSWITTEDAKVGKISNLYYRNFHKVLLKDDSTRSGLEDIILIGGIQPLFQNFVAQGECFIAIEM